MAQPKDTVVDQIVAQAPSQQVIEAMLLGSSFEGGWNAPFPVGDGGTSFGPFQEHQGGVLTAVGETPQGAEDPAKAVHDMLPYYEAAVNQVPQELWNTNTELAAQNAAVLAERPAQSYLSAYGQKTLDQHWTDVVGVVYGDPTFRGDPGQSLTPPGQATTIAGALSGSYTPAVNVFGTVFKYIDGFLNPDVSLVPGWVDAFTGVNQTAKTIVKFTDRIVGFLVGIGFVYIGVRVITNARNSPGSVFGTAVRAGTQVYTGNVAAVTQRAASGERERRSVRETQARQQATAATVAYRSDRSRQESARLATQRQAEARRTAESSRASRRPRERASQ